MDMGRGETNRVVLDLSHDEALILFELLGRWEWSGVLEGEAFWRDQAEQRVIWDLHASLEPAIDESFTDAYGDAVSAAWARVRDSK